jgi:lipopolysaccharide/colanic/teichoic acid biosynthesis glycosyltransferase
MIDKFKEYYEVIFSRTHFLTTNRVIDLIFASILLIIFSPVILFSIIYIYIKDGKPIFFKQIRHGINGKEFKIIKFRTMDDVKDDKGNIKQVMTKSGGILRKFRFNEIPQLINVINGELSIVGPRPDVPRTYEFCNNAIPYYNFRVRAPQGITGHAQVLFKYVDKLEYSTFAKRLSYDLYYVKNMNLQLYLVILLKTIETVLMRKGK